ncbi:uncharacterized protein LOC120787477 [Xiphias gladius]|uniref:uncharacterized protein LOC120787477 n=1 Tax=Xiphias gladius TaxID=8245 RepID=UPI001A99ACF7|nr:uncharacterized protein LOC120787477 [Xiphias gladius]
MPEEEMMSESSDEELSEEPLQEHHPDLNAVDKLNVCQSQLKSLFIICPACRGETQGNMEHEEGTYMNIMQHMHQPSWSLRKATTGHQRLYERPLLQAMVLDRHAYMAGIADTGARVESPVAVKNGLTHELEADVMMSHITTTVGAMELYAVSPSVPVSAQLGVTWG